MLVVRPVRSSDHPKLLELAELAGIGMTSLPPDTHVLEQKIQKAVASFQGKPEYEGGETFLFVLEDDESGEIVGTTGIVAHVGLRKPFYSYKLSMIVQASQVVDVYAEQRVLHMVNDYTGASEIGSLFLKKEYRRDGIGKFLSRCRYLMLAQFPELFGDLVIAEIRGVHDEQGNSPFYEHLCKHFFKMEFALADTIHATKGGQFISDLMPKYPIYVDLLDAPAQEVIGKPFTSSAPAMKLLQKEGFTHEGYVDVFDAGPSMQAETANICTVKDSQLLEVAIVEESVKDDRYIISNTVLSDFRVVFAPLEIVDGKARICKNVAAALRVQPGDSIRVAFQDCRRSSSRV